MLQRELRKFEEWSKTKPDDSPQLSCLSSHKPQYCNYLSIWTLATLNTILQTANIVVNVTAGHLTD